jgi:hypothetical protein
MAAITTNNSTLGDLNTTKDKPKEQEADCG